MQINNTTSIVSPGATGLKKSIQSFNKTSDNIANSKGSLLKEKTDQISSYNAIKLNLATIKVDNETKGELLDLIA